MPRYDQFIGGEFEWFTAEVEDINDPEKLNRVKVRCHGWHTDDTGVLKTSDLPWATVIMPATSASYKGIGSNHELMVGSWVVGFFRDGPSAQDPIIMGSIATKSNGIIDIPTEAQLNPPTNKVHKTEGGHLIEYDNTDGSKRINIQHASGTTININNDGTVEINAINDIVISMVIQQLLVHYMLLVHKQMIVQLLHKMKLQVKEYHYPHINMMALQLQVQDLNQILDYQNLN